MAEKTFNFNIIGTVDELKAYQSGTVVNTRILDGVTSLHPYIFYNMTSLQSVDFNQVEIIPIDCCRGCTNLTQAVFSTHTTQINDYAFYGCSHFQDTALPHTLTDIGQYAFRGAGSAYNRGTYTFTLIDEEGIHTTVATGAFESSHLSVLKGYLNNVGDNAFNDCQSLTEVDVEIHGTIGENAFAGAQYIQRFRINPNSVIQTRLFRQYFYRLAYQSYTDPNLVIAPFDFRNSTFTEVWSGVWGECYFAGTVYFPDTLTLIVGNFLNDARNNWKLYFNSVPTVSSSSYLRSDTSNFTVKYFFPYELMDQASSATNWSTHTSQMIGYGSGFEAGTTLPQYVRSSGVAITWYSDDTLTTQITTSSSATDTYYCTVSANRIVWFVNNPALKDASVTISDGTNVYVAGDPVLVGTSITVTPSYTDPAKDQLFVLKVNGTNYTSTGTATVTMDQDLAISCMYYDGVDVPFYPNLVDNDWDMIKLASKLNAVPSTWQVGDTKSLLYTHNGTDLHFTARLVDKTGKFTRASDGSTAYLYFELTELLPTEFVFNSTNSKNADESPFLLDLNSGTEWAKFDVNLRNSLENVIVPVDCGNRVPITVKLFLARAKDFWGGTGVVDEYYVNSGGGSSASPLRVKQQRKPDDTVGPAQNYITLTDASTTGRLQMVTNAGNYNAASEPQWTAFQAIRFAL